MLTSHSLPLCKEQWVGQVNVLLLGSLHFYISMVASSVSFFFQEVLFFEEGEPKIDGEPGDLKVRFAPVSVRL